MRTFLLILVVAAVTALIRFAPFLLFPPGRRTPRIIIYLGRVLPQAAMGMLVIYCLKDVRPLQAPHALPELIALLLVVGSYLWRRSTLLSILAGTLCYMAMVQFVV
ncbi:MAG: branched-chain amino acid transporter permease [Christensenellales bacterium]